MNLTILELIIAISVFISLLFLYQRREVFTKRKIYASLSSDPIYDNISPIKKELAKNFFKRSSSSQTTAYGVLILTILIIFGGAYFFLNASKIANHDTAVIPIGSEKWNRVQDSLANKYLTIYCNENGIGKDTMTTGFYYNLMVQIKEAYKPQIDKETTLAFEAEEQNIESQKQSSSLLNLIGSMTIRLMISFFVFYLVQIFLKLYRYNLKISDFYISRFDAILSYEEMKLPFEKTIEVFSHSIDVGNVPKSPVQTAIEILKATKDLGK